MKLFHNRSLVEQEPEDRAALCPELEDTYSDKMNIIYLFHHPVFTQVLKMPSALPFSKALSLLACYTTVVSKP